MQTDTIKLRELTVRYAVKKDGQGKPVIVGRTISSPGECATALMALLRDEPTEVFAMLCLTTQHRVIAYHEVSRGALDATIVHPREVFKAALLANAAAILVTHYVARHIMRVMCPESLCGGAQTPAPMPRRIRRWRAHNEADQQTMSLRPLGREEIVRGGRKDRSESGVRRLSVDDGKPSGRSARERRGAPACQSMCPY